MNMFRGKSEGGGAWRFGLVLAMLLMASANAFAGLDSKGTEFWLMFNSNYDNTGGARTLFITSDVNTQGSVDIPGLGFSQGFTVPAHTVAVVEVPVDATVMSSDTVEAKGIHITADHEVSVYGLNRIEFTTDAFLGLPVDVLGTDYMVLAHPNVSVADNTANSEFGIVAISDNTTVTINPNSQAGSRQSKVPFDITLDAGETYQLLSATAFADLSGTTIVSNHPIAVFGGHSCANVPDENTAACDHVVEQLPPTTAWGKRFATMPLATRFNGDTFRILAMQNNTSISINGSVVATLARGEVHQQIIAVPSVIIADAPVLVAQLSNGSEFDGVTSDPFMMLVTPLEQFLGQYTITTPESGFSSNFANLVVPDSVVGSVTHDGSPIPVDAFVEIGNGFSGAQLPIGLGAHTFASSLPIGVFVYGFDVFDSYGYPGGLSVSEIAKATSVVLEPATATHMVGTQGCVGASVTDQNTKPLEGIRVDFAVTGANHKTGFGFTAADGTVAFCYTGTVAGSDRVKGSVGALSDTVAKTWVGSGLDLTIDIKFLRAPNAFSCRAMGTLPVTLFGTAQLDVTQIDLSTLRLARLDGTGTPLPRAGAATVQDRGNPANAGINRPSLHIYHPDGHNDLDIRFNIKSVGYLIGCSHLPRNSYSARLIVTGKLKDGTPFTSRNSNRLLVKCR